MIYVFAGDSKTFGLELNPPADTSSVVYTLRDNAGNPIAGVTNVAVQNASETNVMTFTIAGSNHTIAEGLDNESRFLCVSWTSVGISQGTQVNYVVTPFLPIRTQFSDVLSVIGTNVEELKESEIDVVSAAMYVRNDITPLIFDAATVAGGMQARQVNQLIALWAAFEVAPSIQFRIAQSEKNELAEFQRFNGLDPVKWVSDISEEYDRVKADLCGTLVTQPVFMALGAGNAQFLPPWCLQIWGYNNRSGII